MSKEAMKMAFEVLKNTRECDAVSYAIKTLEEALAKQEQGEQDNYQGSDAAKAAHMMDLYTALGVKWGEDPFAAIAKMRSIAEAERQERPTGPATSADRYFYEAGFEAGRQQGMKQEQGEPVAFEEWLSKQHGDPEEIGFLQALRIAYISGQYSITTPQPAQKPLTDEQIDKAMAENKQILIDAADDYWKMRRAYARIIEAAHGIKS